MPNQPPNLRNLSTIPAAILKELPAVPREGVELFLVTAEGAYNGQRYSTGELIVCRGDARNGDITVLVPKGHGRPRLGRIDGARLRGDAEELCHPARFSSAGRVVARYRHAAEGWIVELQDGVRSGSVRADRSEVGGLREVARAAVEGEGKASSTAQPAPKEPATALVGQTDPPQPQPGAAQLGLFVA